MCVCVCVEVCLRVCVSQVLTFPAPNTLIIAYQQFGPEVFLCRQLIWFISKLPVRFDQRTRREGKQEKLGEWQKLENRENKSEVGGGGGGETEWEGYESVGSERENITVCFERKMGGMTLEVCPDHSKRKKMIDLLAWEMTCPSRSRELLTRCAQNDSNLLWLRENTQLDWAGRNGAQIGSEMQETRRARWGKEGGVTGNIMEMDRFWGFLKYSFA